MAPMSRAFHASLNVADLRRSVEFYRVFFGLAPAKQRGDYAKFELPDPPLVLSLIPGRPSPGGSLNHFGLRVADAEALIAIQLRLEAAGMATQREEGVACCHSTQTKFWVSDPDRVQWEIYVLHEGEDEDDDPMPLREANAEVPASRIVWRHYIGEPWPERIPHEAHSVHEVLLEGTANLTPDSAPLSVVLAEAFRVLRPGGELRLHGLSGDSSLVEPLPALPGPASVVEYVPSHQQVVRALVAAQFVNVHLEKLSSTAHFTVGTVLLRELVATARKPGHRPKAQTHHAIYLGPLSQATDDYGNVFVRGEPTSLNIHDWQAASKGPAAHEFLFL